MAVIVDPWSKNKTWLEKKKTGKKNVLIICGEEREINCPTVTFKENKEWSFEAAKSSAQNTQKSALFSKRTKKKGGGHVTTIDELKEKVSLVVFHSDVTYTAQKCFGVLVSRGFSTHLMLDYDGTLYQGVDLRDCSWHGGATNPISIGCDLNNRLDESNDSQNYVKGWPSSLDDVKTEMADPIYSRGRQVSARINGTKKTAFGHTEGQYQTMITLLKFLRDELGLKNKEGKTMPPLDEKGNIVDRELEDYLNFKGWIGHYHCKAGKWDPGPGMDWKRVIHGIHGGNNEWPVKLYTDMRQLFSNLVELEANKFYLNTERSDTGGYYPVGLNQTWHNGVHLHGLRTRVPVTAMVDGKIVAARFTKKSTLGDSSFVLLEHRVPLPKKQELVFFTLYMHLDGNEPLDQKTAKIKWIKDLYRVDTGKDPDDLKKKDEKKDKKDEDKPKKKRRRKRRKRRRRRKEPTPDTPTKTVNKAEKKSLDKLEREYLEDGLEDVDIDSPIPEIGNGMAALKADKVALLSKDDKTTIPVRAGDIIGYMGTFRDEPLVHVEVFSKEQMLDMDKYGEHWRVVDEEVGASRFIETEDIWKMFDDGSFEKRTKADDFDPRKVLRPDEVISFYQGGEPTLKAKMRKSITRHMSEWSRSLSWVTAIGAIQSWANWEQFDWDKTGIFTSEIKKVLPFMWLNEEVAKHIKIDKKGVLYFYHPVYFVVWLTAYSPQKVETVVRGKSLKKIREAQKKLIELKKQLEQDKKNNKQFQIDETTEDLDELEDLALYVDVDISVEDQFTDFYTTENGEWPIEYLTGEEDI